MHVQDLHGVERPVAGIDFETYYETGRGAKFTLSKMTTTTYVRSPKFKVHGASLRFPDDEKAWWVSGCELRDVMLDTDWSQYALLAHNMAFDGLIASHHYGVVPAYYLDTLSMSRGEWGVHVGHSLDVAAKRAGLQGKIEGALAETANIYNLPWHIEMPFILYGNRDVDEMWGLFQELYYDRGYPEEELHIIDITLRAFCDPKLVVNKELCLEEAAEEAASKSRLVETAGVPVSKLMSNPQFATLLEERGVEPPTKISPRTGSETFAFAKGDLEFQALEHDARVADLVRARKAVKSTINETRAHRLIAHSDPTLPVLLNYALAHTHRWTGGDKINLQNLSAGRKGQSDRLRRAIEAPDGQVVVVVDSSQIECRTNAWAADEETLLDSFKSGGDPYADTASDVYGYEVIKGKHKAERQVGKVLELGAGYGMGWEKFAYTVRSGAMGPPVDISDDLARLAISTYRKKRYRIPKLWGELDLALTRMAKGEQFELGPWRFDGNTVQMPNGLLMRYPGLVFDDEGGGFGNYVYKSRNGWTSIYGGKFCENLIQSTARTIVAFQSIEIARRYPVVFLVHDEVVYLAPEEEADDAYQFGLNALKTPPAFCRDLPVDAEGGWAKNYSK